MSDVNCPNCGEGQEINHDDGYGYEEDQDFEQQCSDCNYTFIFTTGILYVYNTECQEDDHDMQPFGDKWPNMYGCEKCDHSELRSAIQSVEGK